MRRIYSFKYVHNDRNYLGYGLNEYYQDAELFYVIHREKYIAYSAIGFSLYLSLKEKQEYVEYNKSNLSRNKSCEKVK